MTKGPIVWLVLKCLKHNACILHSGEMYLCILCFIKPSVYRL